LDARTGAVISQHWPDAERPIPFGSLVKPFTALAFAETHGFHYPEYDGTGTPAGCRYPQSRGRMGIAEAIASSCNAYFFRLAAEVRTEDFAWVAQRFGLPEVGRTSGPGWAPALVGLGDAWQPTPLELARAYCQLAGRAGDPGINELLAGMALSAVRGTGRAAGAGALAKTGTAPCTHARKMPGDGFAIVLYPRDAPRIALLVSVDGAPGAQAAAVAGRLLAAYR
jgi:cell division protein FtsI/penicillin-binding protein 2